jgi:hypothetical protein
MKLQLLSASLLLSSAVTAVSNEASAHDVVMTNALKATDGNSLKVVATENEVLNLTDEQKRYVPMAPPLFVMVEGGVIERTSLFIYTDTYMLYDFKFLSTIVIQCLF